MKFYDTLFKKGDEDYFSIVLEFKEQPIQRFIFEDFRVCEDLEGIQELVLSASKYNFDIVSEIVDKYSYSQNNLRDVAFWGKPLYVFVENINQTFSHIDARIEEILELNRQFQEEAKSNDGKVDTKKEFGDVLFNEYNLSAVQSEYKRDDKIDEMYQ